MIKYFDVEYLSAAIEFISSHETDVQEKIYYNITKAGLTKDSELFKN